MDLNSLSSCRRGLLRLTRRLLLALFLVGCGAQVDAQMLDPVRVERFFDRAWDETLRDGGAVPGRAPDRAYGYDNLGVGLLGYLTGQVDGTSFARAVDEKLIRPLGLTETTIGVPDWQAEHLAACHSWDASGQPVKCNAKFVREGYQAAGDVTTTGSDMARFMSALLHGGCLDGTCVLRPETFARFTDLDMNRLHPRALGMGLLIYEKDMGGRHAMGHDGGQDGFSTSLTLFPELRVGVFISVFSFVGIPEDWKLSTIVDFVIRRRRHDPHGNTLCAQRRFAEALLPAPAVTAQAKPSRQAADVELASLAGNYVAVRRSSARSPDWSARSRGGLVFRS